jgi:hypothetical protein
MALGNIHLSESGYNHLEGVEKKMPSACAPVAARYGNPTYLARATNDAYRTTIVAQPVRSKQIPIDYALPAGVAYPRGDREGSRA